MIYFLSGLPRSGSTLLGSILNQNPDVYVSPTSPLLDLLCLQNEALNRVKEQYTFDDAKQSESIYKALPQAFYQHINKPHIIDKHRAWARNVMPAQMHINSDPKVICTYRPVAEVVVSFLKLVNKDPNNFIDAALREKRIAITTENRAKELWEGYISDPWQSLQIGLENYKKNLYFVSYSDLIADPAITIDGVYDFLGIERYQHEFDNISNSCGESKDAAWGLKDLHTIRPKLAKTSDDPVAVLGENLCKYFNQFDIKRV
jgi:sulfotransferase